MFSSTRLPVLMLGLALMIPVGSAAQSDTTMTVAQALFARQEWDQAARDVDGDGAIDFLLTSAWSAINGTRSGRMYVVSGR
jgi:hypothetical protein